MKKLLKKRYLVPACYLLLIAGWLLLRLVWYVGDGGRTAHDVQLDAAQPEGLVPTGVAGGYVSETGDPQLVFAGPFDGVRLVRLRAEFAISPGEMELFYTRSGEEDFSAKNRVIGVPQSDGSYLYALPAGDVYALRADLGMIAGNTIQLHTLEVNPALPAAFYFVPTLRDVVGIALWGALALCAFYTIIDVIWPAAVKWTKKHGWSGPVFAKQPGRKETDGA